MSATAVDLSVLDSLTPEQAEEIYKQLQAKRRKEARKSRPANAAPKTPASSVTYMVARGNDMARARLANDRTAARLEETQNQYISGMENYLGSLTGDDAVEVPAMDPTQTLPERIAQLEALLASDLQTRLAASQEKSRETAIAARIKIQNKLKGRNTQAIGRGEETVNDIEDETDSESESEDEE